MDKVIYSKFDKHKIADLPRAVFTGRIITILSAGEAERAVDYLLKSDILGFDTETRPNFTKGRRYKVALLQVSNRHTCFLFRLNQMGPALPPAIIKLMETEGPLKIGLSWHDDIRCLHERGDFNPRGFIDIQDHMNELGVKDMSLAKLFANLFHQRISKREQLSNWEADVLNQRQKEYAATDAWACIMLYEEYIRLKNTQQYFLEYVPEPEPQQPKPAAENADVQEVELNAEQQQVQAEQEQKPKSKRKKSYSKSRQKRYAKHKQSKQETTTETTNV